MAREERPERAPQPEREHPIGKLLYRIQRVYWVEFFQASTAEDKAMWKQQLQSKLAEVSRAVEAV